MKIRKYKQCRAPFPCEDKHIRRYSKSRKGQYGGKLKTPLMLCIFDGACNQQHNNLSVELVEGWKDLLEATHQT